MNDLNATPGPWKAVRSDPAEGADVWWIVAGTGNNQTEIGTMAGGYPHERREANANLVAAALDLYIALEALLTYLPKDAAYSFTRRLAVNAIARARGEPQP